MAEAGLPHHGQLAHVADSAQAAALADVTAHGNGAETLRLTVKTPGLALGQVLHVTNCVFGVDADYIIQALRRRVTCEQPVAGDGVGADWVSWDVILGAYEATTDRLLAAALATAQLSPVGSAQASRQGFGVLDADVGSVAVSVAVAVSFTVVDADTGAVATR